MKRKYRHALVFILSIFLWCLFGMTAFAEQETVKGDLEKRFEGMLLTDKAGNRYRKNSRLDSILLIGTDNLSVPEENILYREGGQADFLLLLVINDENDTVIPIQLNRDTMTDIKVFNVIGEEIRTKKEQLCLSFGYGDGGKKSCELTVGAVENLLQQIRINHYYTVGIDSIERFNDLIGGVEVTLDQDFSMYDPEMKKGETLTLKGKQAEYYVRYRYDVGDQTNSQRMERQKDYLYTAQNKLTGILQNDFDLFKEILSTMQDVSLTDMSLGFLINMANKIKDYTIEPFVVLPGINEIGENGFMEFIVDEDALKSMVLSVFYSPEI